MAKKGTRSPSKTPPSPPVPPFEDGGDDSDSEPETVALKDQMDYAMKHFLFIADQRLKIFQFYLVLLAASITVTASLVKDMAPMALLIAAAMNAGVPLIFYIIEQRNQVLLDVTGKGIRGIEQLAGWPEVARISTREKEAKYKCSYKMAFGLCYAVQFGTGLALFGVFTLSLLTPVVETLRGIQYIMNQANQKTKATNATPTPSNTQGDTDTNAASKTE